MRRALFVVPLLAVDGRRGVGRDVRAQPGVWPAADGVEEVPYDERSGSCDPLCEVPQGIQIALRSDLVRLRVPARRGECIHRTAACPLDTGSGEFPLRRRPSVDARDQASTRSDELVGGSEDRRIQLFVPLFLRIACLL